MLNSLALIDLLAPALFLGCACFVWLGTRLSLATVVNVLRLSSIDRAQVTDALTGLRGRQYLDRRMQQEIQCAERRVATHTPPAAALAVAERLRREIELGARKALREAKGARHAITVSIGVAGREAGDSGPADLFGTAEKALQKAKREGRNRVALGGQ